MQKIAIALNTAILLIVAYELLKNGFPNNIEGFLFASLFSGTAAVSIIALVRGTGESWLALYLRRKTLEEKRKIESLNGDRKG